MIFAIYRLDIWYAIKMCLHVTFCQETFVDYIIRRLACQLKLYLFKSCIDLPYLEAKRHCLIKRANLVEIPGWPHAYELMT